MRCSTFQGVWLACLAFLALLAGCSFAEPPSPQMNRCDDSSGCGAGERCDADLGICVNTAPDGYKVVLRVTPASNGGLDQPPVRFKPRSIDSSSARFNPSVPAAMRLRGWVGKSEPESERETALVVELQFRAVDVGPGPSAEILSVSSSSETPDYLNGLDKVNFEVLLAPDTDYDLSVRPIGDLGLEIPPRIRRVSADEIAGGSLEIVYGELEEMRGQILDSEGEGHAGLRVRAVDPVTERAVSSIGLTDEFGNYILSLDDEVPPETLWALEVGPTAASPWFGLMQSDPEQLEVLDGRRVLTLPPLPPPTELEGWVERDDQVRIAEASMRFMADLVIETEGGLPVLAHVDQSTTSSSLADVELSEGRFSALLLPADYEVIVSATAEVDDDLALVREDALEVIEQPGIPQKGTTFALPLRTVFEGRVRSADGQLLPDVTVVALAQGRQGTLSEVAAFNRSSDAITNAGGDYRLPVDRGYYDLIVQPPEGSGYPWHYLTNRRVEELGGRRELNIKLSAPIALSGQVRCEGECVMGGARVTAFAEIGTPDGGTRYVQIARASADEDGEYTLHLPPELP